MKKIVLGFVVGLVALFCVNFGKTQYSESVGEFDLKKGNVSYIGDFIRNDGSRELIRKICFKDETYKDLARHEGETFLKLYSEGSNVEETLDLRIVKKLEIGLPKEDNKEAQKFCARQGGQSCFWLLVTLKKSPAEIAAGSITPGMEEGPEAKKYQASVNLFVRFEYKDGRKGGVLLHQLDGRIENIRPEITAFEDAVS